MIKHKLTFRESNSPKMYYLCNQAVKVDLKKIATGDSLVTCKNCLRIMENQTHEYMNEGWDAISPRTQVLIAIRMHEINHGTGIGFTKLVESFSDLSRVMVSLSFDSLSDMGIICDDMVNTRKVWHKAIFITEDSREFVDKVILDLYKKGELDIELVICQAKLLGECSTKMCDRARFHSPNDRCEYPCEGIEKYHCVPIPKNEGVD